METDIFKWNEGMAARCIARHNAEILRTSRNAVSDREETSARSKAEPEPEEDDDCRWSAFREEIKRLAVKA